MSKKNYRTLNGLYKALLPIVNNYCGQCHMEKNEEDITIFFDDLEYAPIGGTDIEKLMPVLKRACWMVRRNYSEQRLELLVWVYNDIV